MNNAVKMTVAGFAIFAMVFGSGNIVFPLIIGRDCAGNYWPALVGWLITSVVVPIVGYFGAFLFDGDNKKYLAPIGRVCTFALITLFMVMAGPFGAIARCVNVAFGGIHVVFPNMAEAIFNLFYCVVMIVLAWNPGKLVEMMGIVFTPLKLGSIAIVTIVAIYLGEPFSNISASNLSSLECFTSGLQKGFQTMDLIAAFLMGSVVYSYIKKSLPENAEKKSLLGFSVGACSVGVLSLSVCYLGLLVVGAQYSAQFGDTPNESLFAQVAMLSMGSNASIAAAFIIAVCCLATVVSLSSVFTDFIHKDVLKEKVNRKVILILTGVLTFIMSLLGFDEICRILGIVLEAVYPALIAFVILRIVYYFAKRMHRE